MKASWARLRILSDIRVAKDRVCQLMRENALLSPHRVRQGAPLLRISRNVTGRFA